MTHAPQDIIVVAQEELLFSLLQVQNDSHASYEVHHLSLFSVKEVVPTLVPPVAVHPLQTELVLWRGSVPISHSASPAGWTVSYLAKLYPTLRRGWIT